MVKCVCERSVCEIEGYIAKMCLKTKVPQEETINLKQYIDKEVLGALGHTRCLLKSLANTLKDSNFIDYTKFI